MPKPGRHSHGGAEIRRRGRCNASNTRPIISRHEMISHPAANRTCLRRLSLWLQRWLRFLGVHGLSQAVRLRPAHESKTADQPMWCRGLRRRSAWVAGSSSQLMLLASCNDASEVGTCATQDCSDNRSLRWRENPRPGQKLLRQGRLRGIVARRRSIHTLGGL